MWGLTFFLAWCAPVINAVWEEGVVSRSARRGLGLFAAVLLGVLLFGSARIAFFPPASPVVRVAALAPDRTLWNDAGQEIAWDKIASASAAERAAFRSSFAPYLEDLFVRTQQEARAGAKIVAWSEGAAFILKEDESAVIERACTLARQEGIYLQLGLGSFLHTDRTL